MESGALPAANLLSPFGGVSDEFPRRPNVA